MNQKKSIKSKIIAYLDGNLSQDEEKKLLTWVAESKENTRYFDFIKDLWESSINEWSEFAQTKQKWEEIKSYIEPTVKRTHFIYSIKNWWQVAAILLVTFILVREGISYSKENKIDYITYLAPEGSISQLILPDSTSIFLNAGSKIKYQNKFSGKTREVFLEGEAWFKVTESKKNPFIVHTPFYNVKVLGTEFNVKAYPNDSKIETTLEKGSVMISSSELFTLSEDVILKPGEQLTFFKNEKEIQVNTVNTNYYTSWKDNKLTFLNMKLSELIVLLERKYDVDIVVEDKQILDLHYSGTIKNEKITEFLNILNLTLPIQYDIDNQTIIIKKK